MKTAVFWNVVLCAPVRTDVSEEGVASIIRAGRISEVGTTSERIEQTADYC
jgi:hypothetical protein